MPTATGKRNEGTVMGDSAWKLRCSWLTRVSTRLLKINNLGHLWSPVIIIKILKWVWIYTKNVVFVIAVAQVLQLIANWNSASVHLYSFSGYRWWCWDVYKICTEFIRALSSTKWVEQEGWLWMKSECKVDLRTTAVLGPSKEVWLPTASPRFLRIIIQIETKQYIVLT